MWTRPTRKSATAARTSLIFGSICNPVFLSVISINATAKAIGIGKVKFEITVVHRYISGFVRFGRFSWLGLTTKSQGVTTPNLANRSQSQVKARVVTLARVVALAHGSNDKTRTRRVLSFTPFRMVRWVTAKG